MNRLTIGSVITATLLLVGCGGGGSNDSTPPSTPTSSLIDSSTPTNSGVETPVVAKKSGKGFYVDSAVEGVHFQCGNESGVTDENGTFTFENNSDCNFTIGGINLRDINASLLEDNITILETNTTVAQLLQTLDSDGNASNGIQIPQSSDGVIEETIPSLDDLNEDLLEAVHARLTAEHSNEYNGTVVDINQTVAHLNATRADLEERHIRTHLDVEAEQRGRMDSNGTTQGDSSIMASINGDHIGDANMTIENSASDENISPSDTIADSFGDMMGGDNSSSDENISPHDTIADSFGSMMGSEEEDIDTDEENHTSDRNGSIISNMMGVIGENNSSQDEEHSTSFPAHDENSTDLTIPSMDNNPFNMGNNDSEDEDEEDENSDDASSQNDNSADSPISAIDNALSNMGNNNASDDDNDNDDENNNDENEEENSDNSSSSSDSSESSNNNNNSLIGNMVGFGRR